MARPYGPSTTTMATSRTSKWMRFWRRLNFTLNSLNTIQFWSGRNLPFSYSSSENLCKSDHTSTHIHPCPYCYIYAHTYILMYYYIFYHVCMCVSLSPHTCFPFHWKFSHTFTYNIAYCPPCVYPQTLRTCPDPRTGTVRHIGT